MKKNYRQKPDHSFFGLLVGFVVLASCACDPPHDQEVGVFYPEQVSCNIHSTPESEAIMATISKKNENIMSHLSPAEREAYVDKILFDLKRVADQGDPVGMGFFGMVQYTAIGVDIMYRKYGHMTGRFFPDYLHDNLVTAYTYIYLAADVDNKYQKEIQKMVDKLDISGANETGLETPPAWIEEAKANVESWKAHCTSQ